MEASRDTLLMSKKCFFTNLIAADIKLPAYGHSFFNFPVFFGDQKIYCREDSFVFEVCELLKEKNLIQKQLKL